jgi:DNA-binding HxlR family transcriptional regulator
MTRNSDLCRSHCPINFLLETFGDRWTLLVIRDLMFKGKRSYGEFLQSDEKIATNILANRLARLETHGIIDKMPAPDHGSKRLYTLTDKGRDLVPVMLEITAWSARHDAATNTPAAFLAAYESSRDEMIEGFRRALDEP